MNKIFSLLTFLIAALVFSCGSSNNTTPPAGTDAPPVSSPEPGEGASLSKEHQKMFYETLNIRTIKYRRAMKGMQAEDAKFAESKPVTEAVKLLSDSGFYETGYAEIFDGLLKSPGFGADAENNTQKALVIMCHSYLDKLVGNNTSGLNEEQIGTLNDLVGKFKAAGLDPTAIFDSWNSTDLEEIGDLPAIAAVETAFKES